MVEKVSESIAKSIAEIDVSSDKNDFLDLINKKKKEKKPADMNDMAAVVLRHVPQLLDKSAAHGGGTKSTENKVSAKPAHPQSVVMLDEASDKARRKSILGVTSQVVAVAERKGVTSAKSTRGNEHVDGVSKQKAHGTENGTSAALTQANTAAHTQANTAVLPQANNAMTAASREAAEAGINALTSRHADNEAAEKKNGAAETPVLTRSDAMSPVLQRTEPAAAGLPRTETSARGEKTQAQVNTAAVANNAAPEKQSADINYQFQRWSGDHSVKVSIPTSAQRDGHITLQPSDARAADALSRHIGQIPGQKAELLQHKNGADGSVAAQLIDARMLDGASRLTSQSAEPAADLYHTQQDSEERQRQQQHDAQEEEQE